MRRTFLALMIAGLLGGALFGLSGCYATHASVGVEASSGPAYAYDGYYDPYYRDGHVFVDGHWVWTAYGWQWRPGYWIASRPGFVYVQGYWDYWGGRWAYRPGVWARHRHGYVYLGGRWHRHRPGYRHFDHRRRTWVRHGGYRGHRYGPVRDHRSYRSRGHYRARPSVRDHRGGRVHRSEPSRRSGRRRR
jgi:hypothetical protein